MSSIRFIKNFLLIIIVTILSLESLSFIATKLELLLVNDTPIVYLKKEATNYQDILYGRTHHEKWGAWHVSNSTFRHRQRCFDITMTFNEVGARDDSFANLPESSLILLGDSFAEGFGVARENMSEYLLEQELKVPILNFGSAGNFGPLQQLLIYEEFKYLPHQGIIIYVLPSNDFTDNDQEFWKIIDQKPYQPYFSKKGNPLIPYYFPSNFLSNELERLRFFLRHYTWSSNALRTALVLMRENRNYLSNQNKIPQSFYYKATTQQQSNLVLAHEAILKSAGNRNVLFVIIPVAKDIAWKNKDPHSYSYKKSYWYQSFIDFKNRTGQRVEVLDLMEYLPETTSKLFFDCDPHWSPLGNSWAADVIQNFIRTKKLFEIRN